MAGLSAPRVLGFVRLDGNYQRPQDALGHHVVRARGVWQGAVVRILLIKLLALVDLQRAIAAIINEHVAAVGAWNDHHQLGEPQVLGKGLALGWTNKKEKC